MKPWVEPIYKNLKFILEDQDLFEDLTKESGKIDIKPVSYMRGQTFTKSFIIVDEAQNLTDKQMEMVLSRLGKRSKMAVCGDLKQKDLHKSGLAFLIQISKKINEIGDIELTHNHRHPLVDKILTYY